MLSPDTEKKFKLHMETFGTGIGAVLHQYNDKNVENLVAFYSRKTLTRKRTYSTIKFESLAVVTAIQQFDVYLTGMPFVVIADHKCLQYLHKI